MNRATEIEMPRDFEDHGWQNDEYSKRAVEGYFYDSCFSPKKARHIDGVCINPVLPSHFYNFPLSLRSQAEMNDWKDVPFIAVSCHVNEESRSIDLGYSVECLDEGAWDRPTDKGHFKNLEDAIAFVKAGFDGVKAC